jgi:hypothetical protein
MTRALIACAALGAVVSAMANPAGGQTARNDCSRAGVEELVRGVMGAFNRGDVLAFDRLVAEEPAFQWFSVSGAPGRRIRAAAFDRTTLLRYVSSRHRRGERQRLFRFRFNGRGAVHAHFDFSVVRSASDHPAERVTGKGAVDCTLRAPSIAVWSLGDA